jgi:hypothetical protein
MAEEPNLSNNADKDNDDKAARLARRARGYANLRPAVKGEVRNPTGTNGFRRRQEEIASILLEKDDDGPLSPGCTRIRSVILAAIRDAKGGGPGAASAQKTCIEQFAGKARQQLDVSNDDKSLRPTLVRFEFLAPPTDDDPAGK